MYLLLLVAILSGRKARVGSLGICSPCLVDIAGSQRSSVQSALLLFLLRIACSVSSLCLDIWLDIGTVEGTGSRYRGEGRMGEHGWRPDGLGPDSWT